MRRMVSGLMLLACLTLVSFSALAAGTTVTTFTPFADMDFAAQGYMDLITAWENETGNLVEDYSGLEDDVFMQQMQEDWRRISWSAWMNCSPPRRTAARKRWPRWRKATEACCLRRFV